VRKGRPPNACTAVIGIALFMAWSDAPGPRPSYAPGASAPRRKDGDLLLHALGRASDRQWRRYNPSALTAAHPFLPFGTRVRVTRLDDRHRSVVVRINDRCAGKKKIIDVSAAAARQLDMIRAGIVAVRIQVIGEN